MEAQDKKYGKVVDKILSFPDVVSDYESWYDSQTFRGGYIVGNGRVHEWLDEDDVKTVCRRLELTPRETVAVMEEFDQDRLNGIWDHVCESESDQYTDWLGGCAYDDYRERARLYYNYVRYQEDTCTECYLSSNMTLRRNKNEVYHYNNIKYYYKEFAEFLAKGMSQKDVMEYYEREHGDVIKMRDHLELLDNDSKRTWGGKYPSVVEESTASIHEEDATLTLLHRINSAKKELTNKKFYDELLGRNDNWQEWDSVKEVVDLIDCQTEKMEQMKEAVEFVLDYIKDVVKDFKNILLDQFEMEVRDFTTDTLSVEERVKEGLAKINTFVEVTKDEVVTDQRAHARVDRIKEIIGLHQKGVNVEGLMIGSFKINKVFTIDGETYFKIGCHLFKLSEALSKLAV